MGKLTRQDKERNKDVIGYTTNFMQSVNLITTSRRNRPLVNDPKMALFIHNSGYPD